ITIRIGEDPLLREFAQETVSIGRASSCDAVLEDRRASRRHARIEESGHQAQLVDLHSGNGTFLNGRKVESESLMTGDVIQIGQTQLTVMRLRWTAAPEAGASSPTQGESVAASAAAASRIL